MPGPSNPSGKLVDPVPRDILEAVAREVAAFIPVLGDVFCAAEAIEAFRAGRTELGVIYLVQVLPGPPLPFTHFIAYALGRGEK